MPVAYSLTTSTSTDALESFQPPEMLPELVAKEEAEVQPRVLEDIDLNFTRTSVK